LLYHPTWGLFLLYISNIINQWGFRAQAAGPLVSATKHFAAIAFSNLETFCIGQYEAGFPVCNMLSLKPKEAKSASFFVTEHIR
jgi:hypothetical protein